MRSLAIVGSTVLAGLLAALAPGVAAQRGAGHSSVAHHHAPNVNFAFGGAHGSGSRRSSPYVPYGSLPFPFFGDAFNPDDIYSTGYPVASQPPPFLMQAVREMAGSNADSMGPAMSLSPNREPSSSQPLMIELQNGSYVRVSSKAIDGEALPLTLSNNSQPAKLTRSHSTRVTSPDSAQPPAITLAPTASALPPALLIFRDGHSEEVRDYTIADGILYARGDFYADGYWNKKIELAALDLGRTLQANTQRNVKFALPGAPNEVITRF
jgi:hypothetical protein